MTTTSVTSGHPLTGFVVSSGNDLVVSSGGSAVSTTLESSGILGVLSGGTAIDTIVASGASNFVGPGAHVTGTLVSSGGSEVVLSGGADTGTVLSGGRVVLNTPTGGIELVSSGGSAVSTTVNSGGGMLVLAGGTAIDTIITSGVSNYVFAGAHVTGTQVSSGGLEVLASGATETGTVLNGGPVVGNRPLGGNELVSSGGSAVSVTVDSGAGILVLPGGTASHTMIASGAKNNVFSSASIIDTQVSSGGSEIVWSGAADTATTVGSSGLEMVSAGGSAVSASVDGGGVLEILSGGMLGGGFDFATGGGMLQLGGTVLPSVPISGFGAGDRIDLTDIAYDHASVPPSYSALSGELQLVENGSTYDLTLLAAGNYVGDTFALSSDGVSGTDLTVTCFAPGTRIATPSGKSAVEDLRSGDPVRTASGQLRAVLWLGVQTIATRFADPLRAWPIRVRAGALGENLPARDLLLTPGHALLLDGALVQVAALVNGCSIARAVRVPETLRYYHVELGAHDLLLAEGVPAESFFDGAERLPFDNAAERPPRERPDELPYPRAPNHPGRCQRPYERGLPHAPSRWREERWRRSCRPTPDFLDALSHAP